MTDIRLTSLILSLLPRSLKPYGLLARWDRPVGVHLLFIPTLFGLIMGLGQLILLQAYARSYALQALQYALLFFIGAVAMRGAGCTINDLWDRKLDKQVARTQTRPLASGELRPWQAMVFTLLQCCVGLIVLMFLPLSAVLASLCAVPLIILYPLMKRITWWPQVFLGLTFNFGIWVGYYSILEVPIENFIHILNPSLILFYAGIIFWTLAYDTIYAFQDYDDDIKTGIKSSARVIGFKSAKPIIILFYTMFAVALVYATQAWLSIIAVLACLLILFCFTIWFLYRVDLNKQQACLNAFKKNVVLGYAIVFVMCLDILMRSF